MVARAVSAVRRPSTFGLLVLPALLHWGTACSREAGVTDPVEAGVGASSTSPTPSLSSPASPAAPEPPRPPEIIIDQATIAVGQNRLATGEVGLEDRLAAILKSATMIDGQGVDFVAMRNAKPSQVALVAAALRKANASGANVKTEARDGSTVKLPLSFSTKEPACAAVAWITKDGAIDAWPIGGAPAQRVNKGLAGPDITLGTEAISHLSGACIATDVVVGGDDRFPWGLVFDLATTVMQAHGSRLGAAVLTTNAVPGKSLKLE